MGRRSRKVYVFGLEAFVQHPFATGLWVRTDLSVAKVACNFPGCDVAVGVPCRRPGAVTTCTSTTHWRRRRDAKGKDFSDTLEIRKV